MTLIDHFFLNPGVKQFVFQLENDFFFIPGQFISLHFEHEDKILKRSYSIANPPSAKKQIEFAASYVNNGPGTQFLFHLKPGDKVNTSGPYGRLILKDEPQKRCIFIATSTGITPYRAMIPELKNRLLQAPDLQLIFLEGVREAKDILYEEDFLNLVNEYPNQVEFRVQLSRADHSEQKNHYLGYVQAALTDLKLDPEQDLVYLCGNPAMIDQCFEQLKSLGFSSQHIIREKYISSK